MVAQGGVDINALFAQGLMGNKGDGGSGGAEGGGHPNILNTGTAKPEDVAKQLQRLVLNPVLKTIGGENFGVNLAQGSESDYLNGIIALPPDKLSAPILQGVLGIGKDLQSYISGALFKNTSRELQNMGTAASGGEAFSPEHMVSGVSEANLSNLSVQFNNNAAFTSSGDIER